MSHLQLPPAVRYLYAEVEIDLGSGTARHADGREVALVGQVYEFLELLLEYPGRVLTYWQLAQVLLPELTSRHRRQQTWDSLEVRQQTSIKRAIYSLAYRTRAVLGEEDCSASILVNRMKLGYAVKRPLRTVLGECEAMEGSRGMSPHLHRSNRGLLYSAGSTSATEPQRSACAGREVLQPARPSAHRA